MTNMLMRAKGPQDVESRIVELMMTLPARELSYLVRRSEKAAVFVVEHREIAAIKKGNGTLGHDAVRYHESAALRAVDLPKSSCICDDYGWSVAHEAVAYHESAAMKAIGIRRIAVIVDMHGWSVAHEAAYSHRSAAVRMAIDDRCRTLSELADSNGVKVGDGIGRHPNGTRILIEDNRLGTVDLTRLYSMVRMTKLLRNRKERPQLRRMHALPA